MKRIILVSIFLFLLPLTIANNNLYLYDSLTLQLDVDSKLELISEKTGGSIKKVTAELLLYPQKSFRQKLLETDNWGEVKDGKVTYTWNDGKLGIKEFGYSALVKTENKKNKVKKKVHFPIVNLKEEYKEYLLPTETIDSDNLFIISKATELAEGEDDLFKVVFKLASWVEENVKYDLNTLTASVSQKASWVLKNKQGVCDEMTSLFIAMSRALGIPAKFTSGVSYTTSDLFTENWQPHGWAEVYFPEIGWVSFDITFGEYGYIDVTHIKLRDGFDPAEPSNKYEWLANNVNLKAGELELKTKVADKGKIQSEDVLIEQEILSNWVDFGSYNLIKGILENTADYYVATTLQLAVPQELEISGKDKRTILLQPKEVRETFWVIKVPLELNRGYEYTFPIIIYSEKNISVQKEFQAKKGESFYSEKEMQELTVKDEEKSYSREVSFDCDYPKEIGLGEKAKVKCVLKNSGNTNLKEIDFCLGNVCKIIDLPINQKRSNEITITGEKTGWNKILVSAENDQIEKKSSLEYLVLDEPSISVKLEYPEKVKYGESFQITWSLERDSFNEPREVKVLMEGAGWENKWELEKLKTKEIFILELNNKRTSRKNKIRAVVTWRDQEGKLYSDQKEVVITGEADNFTDRIRLFFNSLLNWLV